MATAAVGGSFGEKPSHSQRERGGGKKRKKEAARCEREMLGFDAARPRLKRDAGRARGAGRFGLRRHYQMRCGLRRRGGGWEKDGDVAYPFGLEMGWAGLGQKVAGRRGKGDGLRLIRY